MTRADDVDALGRASRRAALLSLSGVIVVLISLAYSYYKLNALRVEVDTFTGRRDALKTEVNTLQKQADNLRAAVRGLNYATVTPENQVFQVVATAKDLPGVKTGFGSPVYRFSVYVSGSPDLLSKINKVVYELHHPTIKHPRQEETHAIDNFATHYTGWGCLRSVDVTIEMKDGTSHVIPFDMCKSLGDGWDHD